MGCPELPQEIWHQIINVHISRLLAESVGYQQSCSRPIWNFNDHVNQFLANTHHLDMPWDLPAWQHLDKKEKVQLFELRLVSRAFNRPLLDIMLSGLMIPAGSPIAATFSDLFGGARNLAIKSLERMTRFVRGCCRFG